MFFSGNPLIAIIGDIKDSRSITNRSEVQKKLKVVLDEISEKYNNDISSKFNITLGDEFQGLLCEGANTMKIITEIERKMHPTKIRFGVGIGEITTDIDKEMSIGADGPGYYKAREAIDYLKENERRKSTYSTDIKFETESNNKALLRLINTILVLLTVIKDSWTDRQREIIWDMLEHQDTQAEVANRLNIQQPTVQKSLAIGKYYAYKDALDAIGEVLEEIRRDDG
ncbi:MAG: SatD family protein [Youngiibacter sp.]|nr:SatD family protein [Youngiibacter sp.]